MLVHGLKSGLVPWSVPGLLPGSVHVLVHGLESGLLPRSVPGLLPGLLTGIIP